MSKLNLFYEGKLERRTNGLDVQKALANKKVAIQLRRQQVWIPKVPITISKPKWNLGLFLVINNPNLVQISTLSWRVTFKPNPDSSLYKTVVDKGFWTH